MDDANLETLLELIQNGQHQRAAAIIGAVLMKFEVYQKGVNAKIVELVRLQREVEAEYQTATRRQADDLRTAMTKIENLRDEMMRAIKAADEVS